MHSFLTKAALKYEVNHAMRYSSYMHYVIMDAIYNRVPYCLITGQIISFD